MKNHDETMAEKINAKDLHIKNLSERERKLANALRRDNERALYEINTLEQRIYNLHGRGNAWRFVAILGWGVFLGHIIGHW